jgi:hypothetical protein
LAEIAVKAKQVEIRLAAINQIEDQQLLSRIIEQKCGKDPALVALAKITDGDLLGKLAATASSKASRRLAAEKLAEIEQRQHQPDESEIIDKALTALASEAAGLPGSSNWDKARTRLEAIKEEWHKLDSEGSHPAHGEFTETCSAFENKLQEIEHTRQLEQAKATRYEEQQARFNEICTTIEGLAGSTDDKAEEARDEALEAWQQLVSAPAEKRLVPSEAMKRRFDKACQAFAKTQKKVSGEKEIVATIESKILDAEKLVSDGKLNKAALSIKDAGNKLAATKLKYFSKAALEKLQNNAMVALAEAEKAAIEKNVNQRQELCVAMEKLAGTNNYKKAEEQSNSLRHAWRGLEPLTGSQGAELDERFNRALDEFAEKSQAFHHDQEWQLWANLGLKEKLIEQVEALDKEEDLEFVFDAIKKAQADWKKVGPVPRKKSQKTWDKFHATCNRNFKRTEPYLEEIKKRRDEAMSRRREICLEAEEMAGSTTWNKTAASLKALQKEWKELIHGSRRQEEKLYRRFRKACDLFFSRRQEDYQSRSEERLKNLAAKEKLCEEAENLAADPQLDHPGRFRSLQSDWKKIGRVPKEKEKEIWKRFRAACDNFFHWLEEQYLQNLKDKEVLCKQAEVLTGGRSDNREHKEIADKIAELQQKWKEIGPVPIKQKDAVWQRFHGICDSFFKARRQQLEKEREGRHKNQAAKEEMLATAEELANQATDNKKTSDKLQALQKKWQQTGSAPQEKDRELNEQFNAICDAFFEGRHQYFSDLADQRLANQKKKESLCLRLENIIGKASASTGKKHAMALSLAEELKQAMQDNIMLAGRRNEKRSVQEEVKRIEQDWKKTGAAARDQERQLQERFRKALACFYQNRKKK